METMDLFTPPQDESKRGKPKRSKKKGLILNEYVFDLVDELDDINRLRFLDIISAYERGEELPEMDQAMTLIFKLVAKDNAQFDPEHKKTLSEVRSEAGKKGAASRAAAKSAREIPKGQANQAN